MSGVVIGVLDQDFGVSDLRLGGETRSSQGHAVAPLPVLLS